MKLTKWLRAEDLEGIEKHGMSVYRSIIFTVAIMTALMLVMLFAHQATAGNASNRYYEKADFRHRYKLTNKEFRELRKSGAIQDTLIKWCAKPKVVYKTDSLEQKILIVNDVWFYKTKDGMCKVRY